MTEKMPLAANDNPPPINAADVAVADRARYRRPVLDEWNEWCPPRQQPTRRGTPVRMAGDGPSDAHRLRAGIAWYSSGRFSGQYANENQDWPLGKLLKTEGRDDLRTIADRYRGIHDRGNGVTEIAGDDASDLPAAHRLDIDGSTGALRDKGARQLRGQGGATIGLRTDPSQPRPLSKPIPKAWDGDRPLLAAIDARRELAAARAALGWLGEAFEAAVVGGETLEAIGRANGVGNAAGAKGAGRALVFLGFKAVGEFWYCRGRRSA